MNNIAPKPPLARQANNMAGYGRYGDSQLVHMNPYEVQGLAAMSPTGQLTTNPMTGQPEAFLPFLAPLLAPMIGSAIGGAALGGTALGAAGAGALGAGLATWAESGDFEKGLVSAVTGFGLGQVLGAGADAAKLGTEVGNVATAQTGLAESSKGLMAAGVDAPTLLAGPPSPTGLFPSYNPNTANIDMMNTFSGAEPLTNMGSAITPAQLQNANLQAAVPNAQRALDVGRAGLGPAQRLSGLGSVDGLKAMGKQALSPSSMLPIGVGLGTQAQLAQQDDMEALRKEKLGQDRAYSKEFEDVLGNAIGVSNRSNQRQGRPTSTNPYAGQYAATGGVVGMNGGGDTEGGYEDFDQNWEYEMAGTIDDATSGLNSDDRYFVRPKAGTGAERQSFLRGDFKQQPPTDYRHGFEKEFQFFDYVKDRPMDRYLDAFGSGPSNYLAGLLGLDQATIDDLGTPTAVGTAPLNTYTDTKADQFSGIDNFSTQGLYAPPAAAPYEATVDTVAGGIADPTPAQIAAAAAEAKRIAAADAAAKAADKTAADKAAADLAEAKRLADIETARIAAAEAAAQRQADFTAELDALNIDVDGVYLDEEGDLVYDVMQDYAGLPSLNETVANYYTTSLTPYDAGDISDAVVTIADRRELAETQTENLAAQFQGDVADQSPDDIAAIVQGISSRDWTVAQVAAQFGLPEADVQEAYDSMAAATGGRMASGGQAGTKRFMTSMGPIELAGGGIAEIPVNQEFMQEIPPEMAMVQDQVMAEEPLDTDYNELIALTVEAIRGNIENPDTVINMFIEEYGQERFLELRTAVLQSIVPNAQTEGLIAGSGSGMDDEVMGMIGENQQVAVSPGEYIVAADVLSGLGDGDTDAGADVMDEVQANVRMARSGGRQPAPIDLSKVMPA